MACLIVLRPIGVYVGWNGGKVIELLWMICGDGGSERGARLGEGIRSEGWRIGGEGEGLIGWFARKGERIGEARSEGR